MFEGQRDRGDASGDTHAMALEIDRRDLTIRINDDEVCINPSGNEVGLVEGKCVSDLDCTEGDMDPAARGWDSPREEGHAAHTVPWPLVVRGACTIKRQGQRR
jgi:hypothetical protein